jgi:RNA polymerase sigma factor (sigma-70 family)
MKTLTKAQQKLVADNMGIAIRVLGKLNVRRGPGYDDCRSEAMLALCKAAASFDPSKAGFSTWAWLKVAGAVKDWMYRQARIRGSDMLSEDELREMHSSEAAPDEQAYDKQFKERVREQLEDDESRADEAIRLLAFNGLTIRQCAATMGVTKRAVAGMVDEARDQLADLRSELGPKRAAARAAISAPPQ